MTSFYIEAFQDGISSYISNLKPETWCWGGDGESIINLECRDKTADKFSDGSNMYVGTLTYSETQFAGSAGQGFNKEQFSGEYEFETANYYLLSDYMRNNGIAMLTLTTSNVLNNGYMSAIQLIGNGYTLYSDIYEPVGCMSEHGIDVSLTYSYYQLRPAVVLRKGITATGTGTITDPYKVG